MFIMVNTQKPAEVKHGCPHRARARVSARRWGGPLPARWRPLCWVMELRDRSLITGRWRGYKMGKSRVQNLLHPPTPFCKFPFKGCKLVMPPPPLLKGGNILPPLSVWLNLQAPVLKLPQKFFCPPPPHFSRAKAFFTPPFYRDKTSLATPLV